MKSDNSTKKSRKKNKFIRFVMIPFRVLGKARDLYVKSLTNYAERSSLSNSMGMSAGQFSTLPKSFSVGPARSTEKEDYSELLRAASVRSLGHTNEVDFILVEKKAREPPSTVPMTAMGSKKFPKSVSVGMGFMGRIDEEKSDEMGEEGSVRTPDSASFSRSKSVAVTNLTNRKSGF